MVILRRIEPLLPEVPTKELILLLEQHLEEAICYQMRILRSHKFLGHNFYSNIIHPTLKNHIIALCSRLCSGNLIHNILSTHNFPPNHPLLEACQSLFTVTHICHNIQSPLCFPSIPTHKAQAPLFTKTTIPSSLLVAPTL